MHPPRDLQLVSGTKTSAHLQWKKPDNDGGAKITGYIIEKNDNGGRWIKCNFRNVVETDYVVTDLDEFISYGFRVFAKNSAGATSLPATIDSVI